MEPAEERYLFCSTAYEDLFDNSFIIPRPLSALGVGVRVDPQSCQDVGEPRAAPLRVADGAAEPLEALHFRRAVHLGSVAIGNQFSLFIYELLRILAPSVSAALDCSSDRVLGELLDVVQSQDRAAAAVVFVDADSANLNDKLRMQNVPFEPTRSTVTGKPPARRLPGRCPAWGGGCARRTSRSACRTRRPECCGGVVGKSANKV